MMSARIGNGPGSTTARSDLSVHEAARLQGGKPRPAATEPDVAAASRGAGGDKAGRIRARLARLAEEKARLETQLAEIESAMEPVPGGDPPVGPVTGGSPAADKITLFRSLFRGRDDVFAKRWENPRTGKAGYAPVCANEWKPNICGKPKIGCGACPNRDFFALGDAAIADHLRGRTTVGIYPLLLDGTCRFLAADFDKDRWQVDAAAFLAACRSKGVPAALERSRSGHGGHVWVFFTEPIPALLARRLGSHLLTEVTVRNPDIGFGSYDRLFPSQDTVPDGGFGNLIALPLQGVPRESGNSVFIDDAFEPYDDQWAFLSALRRLTPGEAEAIVDDAARQGRIVGLRLPQDDLGSESGAVEDETPWTAPPSRRRPPLPITGPLPARVDAVLGDQLYIPRAGLPPALVDRLVRLAAFQNPEFYRAQAMRRSTFGIPRIIACAELLSHHVALPRGCQTEMENLLDELGIELDLCDERNSGRPIDTAFLGRLSGEQEKAAGALLADETGVLAAATGFGKTVVAASAIAARGVNTLVLVHRRQLLDQWAARLRAFLDLPPSSIGRIGGGRRRPAGIVDIATIQSLVRKGTVNDIVADYGHLVVDECHHLSAVSFEAVARRSKAKYVLGLSATVTRRDGHHPIVFMQCGPVRFRAGAKAEARRRPFLHRAVLRPTAFRLPDGMDGERTPIQQVYGALAEDEARNTLIFEDVLVALEEGRSPILLTERAAHAEYFADRLGRFARNVVLLRGGLGTRRLREMRQRLEEIPDREERVLVATGRYAGEGFDDARLDTLMLAMPISWRGTLAQYVGRLHRLHPEKREALVYDYVDDAVPALRRMSARRVKGYESLGYAVEYPGNDGALPLPAHSPRTAR